MQNRYVGDIGDFGKLGLLRFLSKETDLSVGINWYLNTDEEKNNDGKNKPKKYEKYSSCDEHLFDVLNKIVEEKNRNVDALEKAKLIKNAKYFNVPFREGREEWHRNALKMLMNCDVVFLDPDNGLEVKSAKGKKLKKYVKIDELADYYNNGSSVIYYQHQARKKDEDYKEQNEELLKLKVIKDGKLLEAFPDATLFALKFNKMSSRYYFFIVRPKHKKQIEKCLEKMLKTKWDVCFKRLL